MESCVNTKMHALFHQRRHPQRVARVVRERQKRRAIGDQAAVERDAVDDTAAMPNSRTP